MINSKFLPFIFGCSWLLSWLWWVCQELGDVALAYLCPCLSWDKKIQKKFRNFSGFVITTGKPHHLTTLFPFPRKASRIIAQ